MWLLNQLRVKLTVFLVVLNRVTCHAESARVVKLGFRRAALLPSVLDIFIRGFKQPVD